MADKKLNIKVKTKGTKKTKKELGGVDNSLKKLAKGALIAGGSFFAARGILSGLKAVIAAAGEQELAEKKLSSQLGKISDALLNKARALQKVTMFGDEATLGVMASIAAFEKDEGAIAKATEATLNMAAAMGMDLKAAGELVAKTLGSSTNALTRYGVAVEGAVGSTERLDSLTEGIARLWGGQAKAQAETMTGSIEQMKNAFGDVAEEMGSIVSPAVTSVSTLFTKAAVSLGSFFKRFTETPLETTIRELKELGASTEALFALEKIQLQRDLLLYNNELKFTKGFFKDIDVLQAEINQKAEETTHFATLNAEGTAKQIGLSKEFTTLQDKRISMVQREGEFADMNNDVLNEMIDANSDLIEQNQEKQEDLQSDISFADERLEQLTEESELLGENLKLLVNIQKTESQLAITRNVIAETPAFEVDTGLRESADIMENKLIPLSTKYADETLPSINVSAGETIHAITLLSRAGVANIASNMKIASQAHPQFAKTAQRAAQMQALMDTYASATGAYKSMVGIPIVGPALAVAASASAVAAGLANVKMIERQKFARGGLVGGPGNSDTVPAMLTPGEFVLSKSAVESIGVDTASRLNSGRGTGITINFSGNVLSKDFIEDEAVPAIKEALRRGGDLGLA